MTRGTPNRRFLYSVHRELSCESKWIPIMTEHSSKPQRHAVNDGR